MKNNELITSYKKLFYLTGHPVFFMAYRSMEKTNTPILLPQENETIENNLL